MWASPSIPDQYQDEDALVILSGGLDSCVALAVALKYHEQVKAITFGYGQRHGLMEGERAYRIAQHYRVAIDVATFDSSSDSSLIFRGTGDTPRATKEQKLPPTFVPGRNAVMIAIVAGIAYGLEIKCIYGGWNAVDYSGYPDCRPTFLSTMESAMNHALLTGREHEDAVTIMAPLVMLKKSAIIKLGLELRAPLHLTWSCYKGGDKPCGTCESCKIRAKGFKEAGIEDPAL
jgi:7-cyano-7-deazaguanine synthase